MSDLYSKMFIQGLKEFDLNKIKKVPKADLHNHFVLGGNRNYIKKKTGITLDLEEANYIALHLVNFSMDNNTHNATKILSFVTDIIGIIENSMKVTISPQSLSYARLSTHLKYLAERIFTGEEINLKDTTEDIRELLKENLRLSMCINRIVKHIKDKYKYDVSPDEQTFLCIHIKRIMQ